MRHSESVAALAKAMVAAQGEIENAHKNATNPHFRNNYADLAEVINTTRPVLTKHGLAVIQMPGMDEDGRATVGNMILHESGEWVWSSASAPLQKNDPQGVGSALTYLRRYSLAAICNIAQEDDDGEAAVDRTPQKQPAAKPRRAPDEGTPACPECKGAMWDNRAKKEAGQMKPNAPDFKCRDKDCDGVFWPGQWPPKEPATTEQREKLMGLLGEFVAPPKELTKQQSKAVAKASVLVDDADVAGEKIEEACTYLSGLLDELRAAS